tara:strand:- start:34 stop:543 length:510 start_codon:yes stop_codon:yes gene_type:complete
MNPIASTLVLDDQQIKDRIKRMAWQVYETHQDETEIILAGIVENGFRLAEMMAAVLKEICPLKISLFRVVIDKRNPLAGGAKLEPSTVDLDGKAILVIDDVLNTGSTLIYGVKYFLEFNVKQIKTIVLVDRNHKNFPVKADFKGLSLSTNLMEHVEVNITQPPYSVNVS